jgi:acetyl-CoA carboxylase biotin carboxyl carrier protein
VAAQLSGRPFGGEGAEHIMAMLIKAHVSGTVSTIKVKPGDRVEEGTVVAILETLSTEMPVEAESDGVVQLILVHEGEQVMEGAPLVELA